MSHATLTGLLLAALAAGTLAGAATAARHRRAIGGLRRQFALAVAVAVGLVLAAVAIFSFTMFVSPEDARLISLVAAGAGVVAVLAARLLAAGVLRDVEAVRDGLVAVGEGRRNLRVETGGRDELAQLARAANEMIERLSVEERARRALVAAVSHDLRTPLTSVRLLAEAIEDEIVAPEERQVALAQMRTHVEALGTLIEDLFELSRLEAGDLSWSMQRVALEDLVTETVDAMRAPSRACGVDVRAAMNSGLAPARANPEKLQRVLFNLIQNAIRHTPADGSVTVRAEQVGAEVVIGVSDTGPGIAPNDRVHVFDAFFRGGEDASRTREGAGLGLAISRAIVEAHGGRIWLADTAEGTCVQFSVPAFRSP